MAEDWSHQEVAATVSDYLAMLEHELRGEPYNKREHNRQLRQFLNGRSAGAVEFKHQNISAVMIELGYPYVDGYKPRANYQDLLHSEVLAQLADHGEIERVTDWIVDAPASPPSFDLIPSQVFVPPPARGKLRGPYERRVVAASPRQFNYLEREAHNRSLGRAGELFVMEVEHKRLWSAGARQLAERVDHVAVTRGDGLGYDLRSFDLDGRERFIEVKTTAFGPMTPFFASAKEVAASGEIQNFHLYRVFKFRERPKIFTLSGSLRESCVLDPVQFKATLP